MDKKPDYEDYGPSLPGELLNLDDPEDLIRQGDSSPDTPKKRRTAWMNRNMQYMMGALALVLVVGSFLFATVLKTGPDYIVGLVTSYSMPEAGRRQLEELLASYADDRNGDGRVMVTLRAFSFVHGTTDQAQLEEALLDLDGTLLTGECMVFLHDDASFEEIADRLSGLLEYTDGTPMPQGATDFKNASVPWMDCKALTSFEPDPDRLNLWDPEIFLGLCENLRVSLRAPVESVKADEEVYQYYQASAEFVKRLQAGDKPH